MTKAEEDWLEYGKKQKKDCGCKGILCMRLEKTGDKCMKRLDDVTALQKKIRKHKQNLKCVKAFTKHQERGKRRCIPAGTKPGSQGGVALVEFQIRTDITSGCGVETQYARKWSRFWQKRKNKPKSCTFVVAMTLTKKVDSSVKKGTGAALIQSFAAVADAKGKGCTGFIWIADMIVREALGSVRFKFAEKLLD